MLRRGASVAAGVWTVPVIESISRPAAAGSAPPSAVVCRSQTFQVDRNGRALTYTPGRERQFVVDLGASFADITAIWVRLYSSPTDPVGADEHGFVGFRGELNPNTASGGVFFGPSNPVAVNFASSQLYRDLLADGRAVLQIEQNTTSPGTFTLTEVQIEVCGTLV
jgi:hypothetical protein